MAASAMSLQDMRDFVRSALDTDSTDLPDAVLDRYIIDGSNRVDRFSNEWSFRAVDYTITTVSGTRAYDIRSSARVSGITLPLAKIVDVRAPNWSLLPRDHQGIRAEYRANTTLTGTPYAFSQWGDSLYLWPAPSSAVSLSILGYRQGIDWVSTNAAPDFPDDFHELIAWWALNRAHAREGDPQMADFYRQEFEAELKNRSDQWVMGLDASPLILGGGSGSEGWRAANGLGPLIYPWE